MTLPPELTLELIKLYKQKQILHEHEFDFVQVNVSYLSETHALATEDLLVYLDMVNDVDSSPAVQAVAQARTANCEAALAKSEHQMFQLMQKVRKLRTRSKCCKFKPLVLDETE